MPAGSAEPGTQPRLKDAVVAVTALGRDRPGLIRDISGRVTELGGNIVHVEQASVVGLFTCFMMVEPTDLPVGLDIWRFAYELSLLGRDLGIDLKAEVVERSGVRTRAEKDLRIITVVGSDRRGVMHAITDAIARVGANVERMHHVARGDFMAFDILVDVKDIDIDALRSAVRRACESVGVDAVIQQDSMFRTRKRLVVFDMDSTIVDGEVIDELAKAAGVEDRVAELTARAMRGELDFASALRERVRLLKGLDLATLNYIARSMRLTPGAEDLLLALKEMGFKVALISGGFTFFTDKLQKDLGFDHAFANELVVVDGKLTGEVREPIIDAERKAQILKELAAREGIKLEEVVAVGDGANDRIMIKDAGLGIAFNAKDVLKGVADGSLQKSHLRGLLHALGATDADLRRIEEKRKAAK